MPASVTTPEALAAALFDVAARTGAALFSVRATRDDDADGEEEGPGTEERITADITFFFIAEDAPERVGLFGTEQVPIRQPIAYALYRPLGKALEAHAQWGADPKSPQRGGVRFPAGAANPDVWFRVSFRDEAMGTWTTARARDRETQQAFPRLADLPLAPNAAAFLEERFRRLDTMFQGQWVLFTGEAGTGRSTSLRAAMSTPAATPAPCASRP